jgi:hypothetical protein
MKYRFVLTIALCVLSIANTFAHAFWMETSPSGKKGQPQEVRIYFGEYADKDITPVADWFSDTKNFTLVLVTPDKKEIKLTVTPAKDHYKATFTPDQDGAYTVVMHHTVKDVYHGSLLDYNSSATVQVGNATIGNEPAINSNIVSIHTPAKSVYPKDKPITLQAFLAQAPAGKKEVEVVAPNGWGKKLYTDSTGKATFTPIWPGRYMVEVTDTEKKGGEHAGKKYDATWRCATYCIEVK